MKTSTTKQKELKCLVIQGYNVKNSVISIDPNFKDFLLYKCPENLNGFEFQKLHDSLSKQDLGVGKNTIIVIDGHGADDDLTKRHLITLSKKCTHTDEFLKKFQEEFSEAKNFSIYSCYGGLANKAIENLTPGTLVATYVSGKDLQLFSPKISIINSYLPDEAPILRIINSLILSHQSFSLFYKEPATGIIAKFKSFITKTDNCNENGNILKVLSQDGSLFENTKKFLTSEFQRLNYTFKRLLSEEDLINIREKSQNLIKEDIQNLWSGILCHLATQKDFSVTEFKKILSCSREEWSDFDIVNHSPYKSGINPLHMASYSGNLEIVKLLTSEGASTSISDKRGYTPLMMATHQGNQDVVNLLENHKILKNLDRELFVASYNGEISKVLYCLNNKADPNAKNNNDATALFMACQEGNIDVARLLLEYGADPDKANNKGVSPIIGAISNGNNKIVELLLKHGANPDQQNAAGVSLLMLAIQKNNIEIIKLLLDNKANIEAETDILGFTPLHTAIANNQLKIAELLLKYGADKNHATKGGLTPISLATALNKPDMVELLTRPHINDTTNLKLGTKITQSFFKKALEKALNIIDDYYPYKVTNCHQEANDDNFNVKMLGDKNIIEVY